VAEMPAPVAELLSTLKMAETLEIMRLEGLDYGAMLETELLGGNGGAAWVKSVEAIYDVERTQGAFETELATELGRTPGLVTEMQAFFGSDQGQRILTLEVEARRALLDEAVEEAAKVAAQRLQEEGAPLYDSLRSFIEAGDLVERNVAGALTANLAFYEGMSIEGSPGAGMSREDMLALVWSQEDDIRTETDAWLMSYLALAYEPLPAGDLDAYIAFTESEAGKALNAALFAAYDRVFSGISRDLGRAAALQMVGDDI
jgi:Uncharacterized protein conserved in bacteria (DUF2059)